MEIPHSNFGFSSKFGRDSFIRGKPMELANPRPADLIFYETPSGCGVSSCSQEILAIGTPILWWAGIFAIALTFGFFVTNRDRISMIILAGIAGTYLPWFLIQSRTTFYFYAISILPFLILALIYSFNWALKYGDYRKQIIGFLVVVALNFIYFLPILLGIEIALLFICDVNPKTSSFGKLFVTVYILVTKTIDFCQIRRFLKLLILF